MRPSARVDREAIVRSVRPPDGDGQSLIAEERDGQRWQIDCLGEPSEVGARITFVPLEPLSEARGVLTRELDASRPGWVCTLRRDRGQIRLTPFSGLEMPDLELAERDSKGAEDGVRVLVAPNGSRSGGGGSRRRPRRGRGRSSGVSVRVVEVLGAPGDPDADHRAVAWKHDLPQRFSRRARLEVEAIAAALPPAELERRLDLRALPFVTIDPASARDHDDAVFAEARPAAPVRLVAGGSARTRTGSWTHRLWVAIADVSHFVPLGGFADAEARRRGNSFYFPDRSIPMLPERLSSELCSLRPDEDRLAMVAELRLGETGVVVDALFHEAVIRSHARLSYEQAAAWLDANGDTPEPRARGPEAVAAMAAGDVAWADSLRCLASLADGLFRARVTDGSIQLELPEIEIVLDEAGCPVDARVRTRNRAHGLIEEAMLAANRAVARALDRAGRETLHRVHPPPSPQKLEALGELLARFGLGEGVDLEAPGGLSQLLVEAQGLPAEERIHGAALRAMSQARYSPIPGGHFALRFEHYLHFTSPIRRYADLEVHRMLKGLIRGDVPEPPNALPGGRRERLAIWLSGRERVAMEAERDAAGLACCALMQGREGERFPARVTGATEYGLFVRLDAPSASGLVPMRLLEGHWEHDPDEEVLVGDRSGARIGVGDRLEVELVEIDMDRGRLAFRRLHSRSSRG